MSPCCHTHSVCIFAFESPDTNFQAHELSKECILHSETTLGERVTEAREARGLTQEEAAQRMAVKIVTFKGWESGKTQPRPNKLQMLAGVLGVPFTWLLEGGEEHDPIAEDHNRLAQLEIKVERMRQLQSELGQLCDEIAHEVAVCRQRDLELEELVA